MTEKFYEVLADSALYTDASYNRLTELEDFASYNAIDVNEELGLSYVIIPSSMFDIDEKRDDQIVSITKKIIVELIAIYLMEHKDTSLEGLLDDRQFYSLMEEYEAISKEGLVHYITVYYKELYKVLSNVPGGANSLCPVGWNTRSGAGESFVLVHLKYPIFLDLNDSEVQKNKSEGFPW